MSEEKFLNKYRIPSARASWHGYNGGIYFVTICTAGREHFFGEIVDGKMILSTIGQIADDCWREIPKHFPNVENPFWVVMPNHIHGILLIHPTVETQNFASDHIAKTAPTIETQNFASLQTFATTVNKFGPQSKNLASVIRGFKIGVTKFARENDIPFAWQTRFYDRIVRNQDELNRIALYIEQNVAKWNEDELLK